MLDEKILLEIEQRANAAIRKWRTGDNYSGDWSLIEKSIPSLIIECRRPRNFIQEIAQDDLDRVSPGIKLAAQQTLTPLEAKHE